MKNENVNVSVEPVHTYTDPLPNTHMYTGRQRSGRSVAQSGNKNMWRADEKLQRAPRTYYERSAKVDWARDVSLSLSLSLCEKCREEIVRFLLLFLFSWTNIKRKNKRSQPKPKWEGVKRERSPRQQQQQPALKNISCCCCCCCCCRWVAHRGKNQDGGHT